VLFFSSSIDLILERLCLEGSRKQAKYSVHALAAVTKDDGLKSLSVLYKVVVFEFCVYSLVVKILT
jgi:sister chromatid cohesion protein PDS5